MVNPNANLKRCVAEVLVSVIFVVSLSDGGIKKGRVRKKFVRVKEMWATSHDYRLGCEKCQKV